MEVSQIRYLGKIQDNKDLVTKEYVDGRSGVTSVNGQTGDVEVSWEDIQNTPTTLSGYGITDAIGSNEKGANNGVATLGANGIVPSSQLPTIPTQVTEATVSGWGFTKNTGTVTTTGTMTANHVVTSNGGTVIKDSGFTIAKSVPSDAVFTDNNQTIKGNGTTFGANDAIDIVAGSNVTVTPDTTNKKITIAATDTKALDSMTGTLGVAHGGTGATDAATARTNLKITPANIGAATTVHNHTSGTTVSGAGNGVLNINGLGATVDYVYLDVNGGSNNARPLVLQSGNKSTGNVGIGVTQPTDKLEVGGNINATGTIKQNGTAVSLSGHTHTKSDITNLGTIGAAAAKSVDSSIATSSTSTNLPTSGAVASFVEGKGYTTNTGTVTTTGTMTNNHVVVSNGTTVIKDSGFTIGKSVPSDAKFTDTTYESKSAASGGTAVSLVTTGEKYTWNNKGTYSKPSGGIPKTDLASAVQTSLGKADSAIQSSEKGANNGVATLDNSGKIPTTQIKQQIIISSTAPTTSQKFNDMLWYQIL